MRVGAVRGSRRINQDTAPITCVYVELPSENDLFGVKNIGEPVIAPTLAALQAAVRDATGAWVNGLPLTPERIYLALHLLTS